MLQNPSFGSPASKRSAPSWLVQIGVIWLLATASTQSPDGWTTASEPAIWAVATLRYWGESEACYRDAARSSLNLSWES